MPLTVQEKELLWTAAQQSFIGKEHNAVVREIFYLVLKSKPKQKTQLRAWLQNLRDTQQDIMDSLDADRVARDTATTATLTVADSILGGTDI